ncbi:diacylglycerol/lipid kinase family protein [Dactylosporangium sp. NPDC051541]|uniref:diacylglycerol/lipid kinase family protein n=1 Tax=Dactylosporangium sp. NPDC051541 TaxID=3363977 RepID=UPI0037BE01C7
MSAVDAVRVAVVAHRKKTFGGGLAELRRELERAGVETVDWREVPKSKKAPKQVRQAVDAGANLIFVWGGDGMVQRCIDALAGSGAQDVTVAILPAGTGNLFASALRIPRDVRAAVDIGLRGGRRQYDLGRIDGEHFAVMAGAGFDAELFEDADRGMKRRAGRFAYWRTALRHVGDAPVHTIVHLDDEPWFEGPATCLLMGNIGTISGGIKAFDDASPFDGRLEVGVTTARGALQWARTIGTMATGRTDRSRFVKIGSASRVYAEFAEPVLLELDGGARKRVKRLEAEAVPAAVTLAVPAPK